MLAAKKKLYLIIKWGMWYNDLIIETDEQLSNQMPEGKCYNSTLDVLKDVSLLLKYWYF